MARPESRFADQVVEETCCSIEGSVWIFENGSWEAYCFWLNLRYPHERV